MYKHPSIQFTYYEQKILPATKIFMTSAKAAKASLLTEIKKINFILNAKQYYFSITMELL